MPNGLTALLISDLQSIPTDEINGDDNDNGCCDSAAATDKETESSKESGSDEREEEKLTSDLSNGNTDSTAVEHPTKEEKMVHLRHPIFTFLRKLVGSHSPSDLCAT